MQYNEKRRIKIKVLLSLFIMIISISIVVARQYLLIPKIEEYKTAIDEVIDTGNKINSINSELDKYQENLNNASFKYDDLIKNRTNYTDKIGGLAQSNNLNISKLTIGEVEPYNKLYKMDMNIEVQGSLASIRDFVNSLYESEIVNRVKSISYRTVSSNGTQLSWMWRDIDDVRAVPWLELESEGTYEQDEETPIGVNDLMVYSSALCYLEVEFIGTGG